MAKVYFESFMEEDILDKFTEFCSNNFVGTAIVFEMFAKSVLETQTFPFEVPVDIPNEETLKVMEDSEKGIGLSKPYDSMEELWKDSHVEGS